MVLLELIVFFLTCTTGALALFIHYLNKSNKILLEAIHALGLEVIRLKNKIENKRKV